MNRSADKVFRFFIISVFHKPNSYEVSNRNYPPHPALQTACRYFPRCLSYPAGMVPAGDRSAKRTIRCGRMCSPSRPELRCPPRLCGSAGPLLPAGSRNRRNRLRSHAFLSFHALRTGNGFPAPAYRQPETVGHTVRKRHCRHPYQRTDLDGGL